MVLPASLGEPGPPEVIVTLKVVSSDLIAGSGVISRPRCDDSRSTINDSDVEDPEYPALPAHAQTAGFVYIQPPCAVSLSAAPNSVQQTIIISKSYEPILPNLQQLQDMPNVT